MFLLDNPVFKSVFSIIFYHIILILFLFYQTINSISSKTRS